MVSGSVNQVTFDQLNYATEKGFPRITLTPGEKLAGNILELPSMQDLIRRFQEQYAKRKKIILSVADDREMLEKTEILAREKKLSVEEARRRIARNMALLTDALLRTGIKGNLVIFGGDTLHEILRVLCCEGLVPMNEIDKGIVFSKAILGQGRMSIISK